MSTKAQAILDVNLITLGTLPQPARLAVTGGDLDGTEDLTWDTSGPQSCVAADGSRRSFSVPRDGADCCSAAGGLREG
jgi:hypothetical protein